MGKKIVKKIVVAGDVLFGTHNFLKQNYVQQIIIWTRRRRENRDATLYSWNIWPVSADVSFYSWFQLFSSCFQPFSAVVSWFSLTGTFAVEAAASSNNWLDLVLFFKTFFFTYMYVLTENLIVTSSVSVFGQAVFWHENKSSVARSVFLFSFAFSIVLSFRQESEFLHGFPNNVLVALE